MLRVEVRLDSNGLLKGVEASGHAGFAGRGKDIVCAAATVLLRTVARTFDAADGYVADGVAERRGRLQFSLHAVAGIDTAWGRGVTEMFTQGLRDLSREFPKNIDLTISND